jgi:hypothetical protein
MVNKLKDFFSNFIPFLLFVLTDVDTSSVIPVELSGRTRNLHVAVRSGMRGTSFGMGEGDDHGCREMTL